MNRSARAQIAAETVSITKAGQYTAPSGRVVQIGSAVQSAIQSTQLFTPATMNALLDRAQKKLADRNFTTKFEVNNEPTFSAAHRLVNQFGPERVAALNFASAKNPGGGFLSGSQAQEESLARASALVACLESQFEYYQANRAHHSSLYTDHMIVSPRVPVFRDANDALLDSPWEVTILTAPAPNAGAISENKPAELSQIEPTFRRRIEHLLAAAVDLNQSALVLGAWGCGVFGNDPAKVARLFGEYLVGDGKFSRAFETVVFAVLDRGTETIAPFAEQFRAKP